MSHDVAPLRCLGARLKPGVLRRTAGAADQGAVTLRVALGAADGPPTAAGLVRLEEHEQAALRAVSVMRELLGRRVREVMSPGVHSCKPESSLAEVCETMAWKEVHRVAVVDQEGKVVGLISALDVVRLCGEAFKPSA